MMVETMENTPWSSNIDMNDNNSNNNNSNINNNNNNNCNSYSKDFLTDLKQISCMVLEL